MGKKLDSLLGRGFKAYKFKALINLSLSRVAILKNQRQARCSLARSDVIELLNLGYHERAIYRVDQIITEQNMLDVLALIESYCSHVIERISLIQEEKECPDELKEAVSSLIYASSRTGDFPELKEMRTVFTARFGREFTACSIELRNNCSVNIRMIQKLSTRQPSLETRLKTLKEIAIQNCIELKLDDYDLKGKPEKQTSAKPGREYLSPKSDIETDFTSSTGDYNKSIRKKYTDVADAAEAAFLSAAYAAEAAKAAVELSRFGKPSDHHTDDDDQNHTIQRSTVKNVHETDDDGKKSSGGHISTVDDDHRSSVTRDESPGKDGKTDTSGHEDSLLHSLKAEESTSTLHESVKDNDNKTDLSRDEGVKERKRPKSVRTRRK